jgi:hypothetical protein
VLANHKESIRHFEDCSKSGFQARLGIDGIPGSGDKAGVQRSGEKSVVLSDKVIPSGSSSVAGFGHFLEGIGGGHGPSTLADDDHTAVRCDL